MNKLIKIYYIIKIKLTQIKLNKERLSRLKEIKNHTIRMKGEKDLYEINMSKSYALEDSLKEKINYFRNKIEEVNNEKIN